MRLEMFHSQKPSYDISCKPDLRMLLLNIKPVLHPASVAVGEQLQFIAKGFSTNCYTLA